MILSVSLFAFFHEQVDMLVMDFAKAFDKVSHSLLVHKLQHYGITGAINKWIKNFLSDRKQAVVVRKLMLFADDTACHREIDRAADQCKMQKDLDGLAVWEQKWLMSFHPDKCEVLHFGKRWQGNYHLRDHPLTATKEAKYLGVTISTDLSWKSHINIISAKANKTLGFLRRNIKIGSIYTKALAYKALVRPQLEYACEVWDPHTDDNIQTLEKTQRRAARWVVNRYRQTSSVGDMLNQLNWPSLEQRRKNTRLSTLYKYHQGEVKIDMSNTPRLLNTGYNTRRSHKDQYVVEPSSRNYRKYSFFPRTIKEFNALPREAHQCASLEGFQSFL
ncbi:hypothetical protein EGW08_013585 [Elysia chlorotica]|uniref:Uncharacterized protein n=1 Tax=Elysia chlorotica TaxID=188477 RepID=A0A3S1B8Q7_ELYCH|nr:hypothetical protein EGW08_013585 [Elysia chlorotica]